MEKTRDYSLTGLGRNEDENFEKNSQYGLRVYPPSRRKTRVLKTKNALSDLVICSIIFILCELINADISQPSTFLSRSYNNNNHNDPSLSSSKTLSSNSNPSVVHADNDYGRSGIDYFNYEDRSPGKSEEFSYSMASPISSRISQIQGNGDEKGGFYIRGTASEIRKFNSSNVYQLSVTQPFSLQFKTTCSYGNLFHHELFDLVISDQGELVKELMNGDTESLNIPVADGSWYTVTFSSGMISIKASDVPSKDEIELANLAGKDYRNKRITFFDGFVGCIQLAPLSSQNEEVDLMRLWNVFNLTDRYEYTSQMCTDALNDPSRCFNKSHIMCKDCLNGVECHQDSSDPENNVCACPEPLSDEIVYVPPYCSISPAMPPDVSQIQQAPADLFEREASGNDFEGTDVLSNEVSESPSTKVRESSRPAYEQTIRPRQMPMNPFRLVSGSLCPCEYGSCVPTGEDPEMHYCECNEGFSGKYCNMADHDPCRNNQCTEKVSVCRADTNATDGYQCFCLPGYTGDYCDKDIDECASHACQNNATCVNLINKYECHCAPGFEGQFCQTEIDECMSDPCVHGKCQDEIADFTCICEEGYEGKNCENDIDECESQPCLNRGVCIDQVANFICNCSDTGYEGSLCEQEVNECKPAPCKNNATCLDLLKDYTCECFPGYEGHDCEIDIDECADQPCDNGASCYQRSEAKVYIPPLVNRLRKHIDGPFDYSKAAGYICDCQAGFEGRNCQINIDDCAKSPCENGECIDAINTFICRCNPGYTGRICDTEINECDEQPCQNGGICIDHVADYECQCPKNYGAKNCSVLLTGCSENPCLNGGTCEPTYDEKKGIHGHKCQCMPGFAGAGCHTATTGSFNGSSLASVNSSDEFYKQGRYELTFRFRTTIPQSLLVVGRGETYFSLSLVDGRLNLQSSLLNNLNGIFSGANLSNAEWHGVGISINESHISLTADAEQTIHPILDGEPEPTHTGFFITYVGGSKTNLGFLNKDSFPYFTGCIQDIRLNGEILNPDNRSGPVQWENVEYKCKRKDQCNPNPCKNNGKCKDLWLKFKCECPRPYLGDKCQYAFEAATFNHENSTDSIAKVDIKPDISRKFENTFDISMFVRTRSVGGTIFRLGDSQMLDSPNSSLYIRAEVDRNGQLAVQVKLDESKEETYTVEGRHLRINDGTPHLISIEKEKGLVRISINGSEHFRKTVNDKTNFEPTVMLIGGDLDEIQTDPPPDENTLPSVAASERALSHEDRDLLDHSQEFPSRAVIKSFKGVIQDVRINLSSGGIIYMGQPQNIVRNTYVVEFFPLNISEEYPDYHKFKALGTVKKHELLQGTVSDNACKENPCLNNGSCSITWNDFTCKCPEEYDGKTCNVLLPCAPIKCPDRSKCQNLGWHGFECVAEASFDGRGTVSPHYKFVTQQPLNISLNESYFKWRSRDGGHVIHISNGPQSFAVSLEHPRNNSREGVIAIYINGMRFSSSKLPILDGDWHHLRISFGQSDTMNLGPILVHYDDDLLPINIVVDQEGVHSAFFHHLATSPDSNIVIGSFMGKKERFTIDNNNDINRNVGIANTGDYHAGFFRGCLADVMFGEFRLPFVTPSQLLLSNSGNESLVKVTAPSAFYIDEKHAAPKGKPHLGCILCYDHECQNRGQCLDPMTSYNCSCAPGFEGAYCETNIDECMDSKCAEGSTCVDEVGTYSCLCPAGYTGWMCDREINECDSSPCYHGGQCVDAIASYSCHCTDEYVGTNCEKRLKSTCKDEPCENNARCTDIEGKRGQANFHCDCTRGYEGQTCSDVVNFCVNETCNLKGTCVNNPGVGFNCLCNDGFLGTRCETDIDECKPDPCENGGECLDQENAYFCNCNEGFTGKNCELDIDECDTLNPCAPPKVCENTVGSFICVCAVKSKCGIECSVPNPCMNVTCENGGTCNPLCDDLNNIDWFCDCSPGYHGPNCEMLRQHEESSLNILYIIIPVIAILILILAVVSIMLVRMARRKRATRGVYSPSQQEYCNPRVELDNVLKPPPEERLI